MTVGATQLEHWTHWTTGTLDHRNLLFWPLLTEYVAQLNTVWQSCRQSTGTHRRLGHVPPLSDVLAVLLVRHADPLFGNHLLFY